MSVFFKLFQLKILRMQDRLLHILIASIFLFSSTSEQKAENNSWEQIKVGITVNTVAPVLLAIVTPLITMLIKKWTKDERQEFINTQKEAFAIGNTTPNKECGEILKGTSVTMYTFENLELQKKRIEKEKPSDEKETKLKYLEEQKQKLLLALKEEDASDQQKPHTIADLKKRQS